MWEFNVWRPALERYATVTRLAVALYDVNGRLACGPVNRTPLFELFAESAHDPGLFAECVQRCLRPSEDKEAISVANRLGIAALGTVLVLNGETVGVAVAGYHLSEFPQAIAVERLARETAIPAARLWDAVRQQRPVSIPGIVSHGELLQVLAETVLRENDRTREHVELSARLQTANAAKDEFLAMVSHELRGPLNAILGWTRLLRTEHLKENARDHALETIERNAWAQTRLVEDLLDVSRIVAGRHLIERQAVALTPVIDAAIASVSPSAQSKHIRLHAHLQNIPNVVEGDPIQLQQIVVNLIGNAIKFTPEGGNVHVRLAHTDTHATLTVSDSGEGIKPEFLPHIFEPFRQQDASTTRVHGGIGLGLTIARHLTALHGGSIRADSPGVGQGATFMVVLPLSMRAPTVAEPPPIERGEMPDSAAMPLSSRAVHVLVVDDDRDARELLQAVLRQAEVEVTAVASAEEALAVIDQARPDVLVSDIGLPDEDGYTLIRKVRMRGPARGGHMPAIAVTAYASIADRERAISSGYDRHLSKPLDPSALLRAFHSLVKAHRGAMDSLTRHNSAAD